jgi:tRNA threonylcarbamoyladenosine biosynthesis protein TsaB
MILAIETSTPVCSVALAMNALSVTEERIEGKGVHSEYTFTFIRELLDRHNAGISDLKAVLFSNGPGSYTGLRIGAAAIKGLLFRQHVPLFTLQTLLSFAVPYINAPTGIIHSVIDARREHLYYQKIEKTQGGLLRITNPAVRSIDNLEQEINNHEIITGTGWDRLRPEIREVSSCHGPEAITAKNLILGWYHPLIKPHFKKADIERFEPDYLTMSQVNNTSVG